MPRLKIYFLLVAVSILTGLERNDCVVADSDLKLVRQRSRDQFALFSELIDAFIPFANARLAATPAPDRVVRIPNPRDKISSWEDWPEYAGGFVRQQLNDPDLSDESLTKYLNSFATLHEAGVESIAEFPGFERQPENLLIYIPTQEELEIFPEDISIASSWVGENGDEALHRRMLRATAQLNALIYHPDFEGIAKSIDAKYADVDFVQRSYGGSRAGLMEGVSSTLQAFLLIDSNANDFREDTTAGPIISNLALKLQSNLLAPGHFAGRFWPKPTEERNGSRKLDPDLLRFYGALKREGIIDPTGFMTGNGCPLAYLIGGRRVSPVQEFAEFFASTVSRVK